jgi:hypothetical protein
VGGGIDDKKCGDDERNKEEKQGRSEEDEIKGKHGCKDSGADVDVKIQLKAILDRWWEGRSYWSREGKKKKKAS